MGQAGRKQRFTAICRRGSHLTSPLLRLRPKSITRSMLRFRTSVMVLIRGPLRLLLLHPLRPLRPLDPLDSPRGSQPPQLPLRQLPAQAMIHGISRNLRLRPRWHCNRSKPTRGTSHISSLLTMIRGISRRGTMLRRLRSQETTRGISRSPRLRLLRFLRQCRAICRAMTRGISPNRFRSRLPAMTRGINRSPHSRSRLPTRGIASRSRNRKSRPRTTNTR